MTIAQKFSVFAKNLDIFDVLNLFKSYYLSIYIYIFFYMDCKDVSSAESRQMKSEMATARAIAFDAVMALRPG